MNYRLLFADILLAIASRGETNVTFAKKNGIPKKTLEDWINGAKPRKDAAVKDFFTVLNALDMQLYPYADIASVGGRIEYLRLHNQLTTSELSALIGCHANTISDWESGRIKPNSKLNALADALKTKPSYILFGTEPRNALVDLPQPTVQMTIEEAMPVEEVEDLELPATIGQVMSSVEIVKIINDMRDEGTAVILHKNFLAKVKTVLGEDLAAKFLAARIDRRGKEQPCYFLPKREAHLMVMSENYKVQAAVYDRMAELEEKITVGNAEPKVEPKPQSSLIENIKLSGAIIKETMSVLNMLGIEGNQAVLGANKVASQETGINILEMIGQSAIVSPVQERYYTPTVLGKDYDLSGQGFNKLLLEQGFQIKDGDKWTPTEKGKPFAVIVDTDKAHATGTTQQVFWYKTIKDVIDL